MVIFRHSRKGWCGDLDLQKNGTTHAFLELRETGLNGAGTPVPDWQGQDLIVLLSLVLLMMF